MKTEYFIELLVTGALGVLTLMTLFLGIVGIDWIYWLKNMNLLHSEGVWASLIIIFPFVYIAGIIIDRFVDSIFDKLWGNNIIDCKIGDREEYTKCITQIFLLSDNLTDAYHYSRKRIRICRSTSFLTSILLISSLLFLLNSGLYDNPELFFNTDTNDFNINKWRKIYIVGSIFIVAVLIITITTSFTAWKTLNSKECERLKMRTTILNEICLKNELNSKDESNFC